MNTFAPLYRWDNGDDPSATAFRLEVAEDAGFTSSVNSLWTGYYAGVRGFRFSSNLDPSTTYYWRAWFTCDAIQGPYSEVWSFTTGSGGTVLPAPALVAPANGSTVPTTAVTLQWSPVSGAAEYLVHWREVGTSGYSYRWVNDTQTTISWLEADTTYEWWVSARNDYGVGTDSETWQFTMPATVLSLPSQGLNHDVIVIDGGATNVTLEGQARD